MYQNFFKYKGLQSLPTAAMTEKNYGNRHQLSFFKNNQCNIRQHKSNIEQRYCPQTSQRAFIFNNTTHASRTDNIKEERRFGYRYSALIDYNDVDDFIYDDDDNIATQAQHLCMQLCCVCYSTSTIPQQSHVCFLTNRTLPTQISNNFCSVDSLSYWCSQPKHLSIFNWFVRRSLSQTV